MASSGMNNVVLQIALDELTRPTEMMDASYFDYASTVLCVSNDGSRSHRNPLGTVRIPNYVEETVPRCSDPMFKGHFRMNRSSFQELLELLGPHTNVRTISLQRRSLACLWYVSNTEPFRSVVDTFNMSNGSLHFYLRNFCKTLNSKAVLTTLISWPSTSDYTRVAEKCAKRAGFPGVVGIGDGSYIPIPGPSSSKPAEYRDSYICRKGFPAMHLQCVCDSTLKFTNVYCAYPGSVHDARVYKQSPLVELLDENPLPDEFHLLGDSAYGLSISLLVPFRDNGHLTHEEKKFNNAHSSTRVDIERSFGLLKGKFRKLKYLDMRKSRVIPSVIIACCALHNFILERESFSDDEIDIEEAATADDNNTSLDSTECRSGAAKRLEIARLFA